VVNICMTKLTIKKFCILPPECTLLFCVARIRMKSDYRHRALIDRFLVNVQTECAYCQVPNEYLNMREDRIPTRCNYSDVYCKLQILLSTTVSTCFGHHYAHHQENKDRVLLHMVFALVVLDVVGCSCGALRCRVRAV